MSRFTFFDFDEKEPIIIKQEEIKETFTEKCQYCRRNILKTKINSHELGCKKNPANIVKEIEFSDDSETQKLTTDFLRFITGHIYDTSGFGKDKITKPSITRAKENKSAIYIIKYLTKAYNLKRSLRALIKTKEA